MIFNSIFFLCIFLPIMLIGYYLLPTKCRNIWLLLGSLGFYAWGGPKYLIYLILSILINFVFGIVIGKTADTTHKADARGNSTYHPALQRAILAVAVILNIGSLVYFKYAGMLIETYRDLINPDVIVPKILMPLGISFYTFQCVSYIIDVYRVEGAVHEDGRVGKLATTNLIEFALYISMFPQLLQGPIVRFPVVIEDIRKTAIKIDDFTYGLERFIIGLAKKALIANSIGEVADNIFACDPSMMATSVAWLGAILYTLQIYFDFSGYSDMAVGLGRLFGFHFMENFNYPYISKSITEFWRRWHISLSNWFRDYLYIPLGGNRTGNVYINLLIVFLATGIWHGAAWGFLIWGLWHGIFMLIERAFRGKKGLFTIPGVVKWGYTMLVVTLGWVLFKLEDISEALKYISVMFHLEKHDYNAFSIRYYTDRRLIFFLIVAFIAAIPWAEVFPTKASSYVKAYLMGGSVAAKAIKYVWLGFLLIVSLIFIVNNTYSPFIYFQF